MVLKSLQYLNLSHNFFHTNTSETDLCNSEKNLCRFLSQSTKLTSLNLSSCFLTFNAIHGQTLCSTLQTMTKLTSLNLSWNDISDFSTLHNTVYGLSSLIKLNLSNVPTQETLVRSQLSDIPKAMSIILDGSINHGLDRKQFDNNCRRHQDMYEETGVFSTDEL